MVGDLASLTFQLGTCRALSAPAVTSSLRVADKTRPMLYGTVRGRPGLSPYVAWDTCGRHVVVALRDVLLLMGRVWWKVALGACHVGRALLYLWHLGTFFGAFEIFLLLVVDGLPDWPST